MQPPKRRERLMAGLIFPAPRQSRRMGIRIYREFGIAESRQVFRRLRRGHSDSLAFWCRFRVFCRCSPMAFHSSPGPRLFASSGSPKTAKIILTLTVCRSTRCSFTAIRSRAKLCKPPALF